MSEVGVRARRPVRQGGWAPPRLLTRPARARCAAAEPGRLACPAIHRLRVKSPSSTVAHGATCISPVARVDRGGHLLPGERPAPALPRRPRRWRPSGRAVCQRRVRAGWPGRSGRRPRSRRDGGEEPLARTPGRGRGGRRRRRRRRRGRPGARRRACCPRRAPSTGGDSGEQGGRLRRGRCRSRAGQRRRGPGGAARRRAAAAAPGCRMPATVTAEQVGEHQRRPDRAPRSGRSAYSAGAERGQRSIAAAHPFRSRGTHLPWACPHARPVVARRVNVRHSSVASKAGADAASFGPPRCCVAPVLRLE